MQLVGKDITERKRRLKRAIISATCPLLKEQQRTAVISEPQQNEDNQPNTGK